LDTNPRKTAHPLSFGLALSAGTGLTLMMIALGIGMIQGEAADGALIGLFFVIGLALFLFGTIGWVAAMQPHKNFDDINVPHYTGHDNDH
jgi:hypothetical protein